MQTSSRTRKDSEPLSDAQALNALRIRVLQAKSGFLALGTEVYMPFIDAQATREGITLSDFDRSEIRQVMNTRMDLTHLRWVELIERALETQQAA